MTIHTEIMTGGFLSVGAPQTVVGTTPWVVLDIGSSPPVSGDMLFAWVGWSNKNISPAAAQRPEATKVTDGWAWLQAGSMYGDEAALAVFMRVADGTETRFELTLNASSPQAASWVGGAISVASSSYAMMDTAADRSSGGLPPVSSLTATDDGIQIAVLAAFGGADVTEPTGWTPAGGSVTFDDLTGLMAYRTVAAGAVAADSWEGTAATGPYTSATWTVPLLTGRAVPALGGANVGDAMGGSEQAKGYILRPDQTNPSPGSYVDPRYGAKAPGQPYRLGRRS